MTTRSTPPRRHPIAPGLLLLAGFVLCCGTASAGPLHDPWLERFQVGTWLDPDTIPLAAGVPAGLLEPARIDTAWVEAVRLVLADENPGARDLTSRRLLSHLAPAGADTLWRRRALAAVDDLAAGRAGDPGFAFLRRERLVAAFGAALARGEPAVAADQAAAILADPSRPPLEARTRLVWRLRREAAAARAAGAIPDATAALWPEFDELGAFDTGLAWGLWVALRREAGRPALPRGEDPERLGGALGRLGRAWLSADELHASDLPDDWQGGLGGILLPVADLPAHFERFATPPDDFERQGWWVRGQRRRHRGAAAAYENLAARTDLKPAWRLDVWRRASERRLLAGAWVEGLADLDEALALAAAGHGTDGLRQRLREWSEQALVLALAAGDVATARRIRDATLAGLPAEEAAAFADEIRHWQDRLDPGRGDPGPAGDDLVDGARHRVAGGLAAPVAAAGPALRDSFALRADRDLWPVWTRWGLALADTTPLPDPGRRRRAARYAAVLSDETTGRPAERALAAVALRLGDRDWWPVLLRQAVDADAARLAGRDTPPWPSPVPDLLPDVRGSELDRHALLGFFLALGDMRGVLGVAYELPGRGLT
ncbi:hypothetical protein KDM41_16195, partial [bacterium]|nr:hypothetical protein [bacterium]